MRVTYILISLLAINHSGSYHFRIKITAESSDGNDPPIVGSNASISCCVSYPKAGIMLEWESPSIPDDNIQIPKQFHWKQRYPHKKRLVQNNSVDSECINMTISNLTEKHQNYYSCKANVTLHKTKIDYLEDGRGIEKNEREGALIASFLSTYESFYLEVGSFEPVDFNVERKIIVIEEGSRTMQTGWNASGDEPVDVAITASYKNKKCLLYLGNGEESPGNFEFCPTNKLTKDFLKAYIYDKIPEFSRFSFNIFPFNDFIYPYNTNEHVKYLVTATSRESRRRKTQELPYCIRREHIIIRILHSPDIVEPNIILNITAVIDGIGPDVYFMAEFTFEEANMTQCIDRGAETRAWRTARVSGRAIRPLYFVTGWIFQSSGFLNFTLKQPMSRQRKINKYICVTRATKKIVIEQPDYVTEGNDIEIRCTAPSCSGKATILWQPEYLKKMALPETRITGAKCTSEVHSTLRIKNVTTDLSGEYACLLIVGDNVILNETFKLYISQMPNANYTGRALNSLITTTTSTLIGTIALLTTIIAIIMYKRSRKKGKKLRNLLYADKKTVQSISGSVPVHEQADLLPFDRKWEFPRERLTLGQQVGCGFFGVVLEAKAQGIIDEELTTTVAVKMAKRSTDSDVVNELIKELNIMSNLGKHDNVVELLGAVTDKLPQQELMIILEFCKYGNLLTYMRENRFRFTADGTQHTDNVLPLNPQVLNSWSYQVSRGMKWLSNRRVLHGDLAARNILLTCNNVVKVSDFGFSRRLDSEIYRKRKGSKLPFKWLAIEAFQSRIFSTQSDVWAFGIVLWEIYSLGREPYPDLELASVWPAIENGYRMEKPQLACTQIYTLMRKCWSADPRERLTFTELASQLLTLGRKYSDEFFPGVEDEFVPQENKQDYLLMCGKPDFINTSVEESTSADASLLPPVTAGYVIMTHPRFIVAASGSIDEQYCRVSEIHILETHL